MLMNYAPNYRVKRVEYTVYALILDTPNPLSRKTPINISPISVFLIEKLIRRTVKPNLLISIMNRTHRDAKNRWVSWNTSLICILKTRWIFLVSVSIKTVNRLRSNSFRVKLQKIHSSFGRSTSTTNTM